MAVQRLFRPQTYIPMTDDKHLRQSLTRIMERDNGVPRKLDSTYPSRGDQIYLQVKSNVANSKRGIYHVASPLKDQVKLDDMLLVLTYWGTNATREEVTKNALIYLLSMNPLPKIVFIEGSVDGKYRFNYVTDLGINYIPMDLQADCYRNLFVKEILWNYAVKKYLETDSSITKICYLDSDCIYVDPYSFQEVYDALDRYDIISPMRAAYYADQDQWNSRYGLLHSVGYHVAKRAIQPGWMGFGIAITVNCLKQYFNYELPCSSLGFGDCIFWWLLTAKKQMRSFMRIPYDKKKLEAYLLPDSIRVGYANTILMHLYHGPVTSRQYVTKCRLVQRSILTPFSDLARTENGMLCWNTTNEVQILRNCLEWLLIFNRQDIKLVTDQDANQLYDWVTGISACPPLKVRKTRFAPNGNELPNHGVSRPVMNRISEI